MQPIRFDCSAEIPLAAAAITDNIADTNRWSDFNGYLMMPGIDSASYETRTPDMVGSRIRVRNSDGSTHVETITAWQRGAAVAMTLHEFGPPLEKIASHFEESWSFTALAPDRTAVTRSFALHPTRPSMRPFLWLISQLFRRAIDQHLRNMAVEQAAS